MDIAANFYRTSSSFRASNASNPIRQQDDEEELKWAALEKLPTYDRLRKGLILGSKGGSVEVDVANLGFQERKDLLDRLLNDAEEEHEKFLLKLRDRIDRVGIELPTIQVRFEHLNIGAEVYTGSRALPTFLNSTLNMLEGILSYLHVLQSKKKHITILEDISGIIRPCRMTLLLGPPSSGKTTLLLALAGKLDSNLEFSGSITYNGHGMDEFIPQKTAAYIGQHDVHIGEMTVRETLEFSARCQGIGSRYEMLSELSRREKSANIKPDPDIDIFMKAASIEGQEANIIPDYVLKVLGLEVCADIMVGDDRVRGISGGQKKRVTTGNVSPVEILKALISKFIKTEANEVAWDGPRWASEMLVGPMNALFMDEISNGLDSSTTFQIVNSLTQYIHILKGTALVSLLQPAPETYELFDDIILLSDGKIVYQGPRENVLDFFEFMGFRCPERKGVADFLQEVTSQKDQQQYWMHGEKPYIFVTANEFVEGFQFYHVGKTLKDNLESPFDKSTSHPAALTTREYGASTKELLKTLFSRELLLMKRNSFVYIFKIFQLTTVALIAMTIFFRTKMHRSTINDGNIFIGALFFTCTMIMFNGLAEVSMTIYKLPVFYKHRNSLFYPSWLYALPLWIVRIPLSFIEVAVWHFLTYYVIGFDPYVGRFFRQYLILLVLNQMASSLFRCLGTVGRNMIVANTFGSFALVLLFAMGGVVLSRVDVKKWWIWVYWASPMMYAQNAIAVNEFRGNSWKNVVPYTNESLGVVVLKARGFLPEARMYWIGVGALLGFTILFNVCSMAALTFLNPFEESHVGKSEEIGSIDNVDDNQVNSHIDLITEDAGQERKRGMVLPFEPHSITFDEIVYSVDMPQEMKERGILEDRLVLLNSVSGAFKPGVLTALMGVSGAGKTTLMDVLAGRKTGGYIDGNITISGYPKKQETFARISGYCEQNDIHSPHVNIYESLLYSAWLRLPPEVHDDTRKMFIDEVMELMELTKLRDAQVGLPGINGLSTEQRKRLTIAVELVANPSIIFMDEPTSGLDARAAAIVMRTVRNTVDTGRTVVCTIHQPSIDIFEAFDELFLLKRGGEEIYVGPLGHNSTHLIQYFEGIQGVSKIKGGYNPATWMLEITGPAQEMALGVDFAQVYKNSELYRRTKSMINGLSSPQQGTKELYFPTQFSQHFHVQCMACLWKQYNSYWRNPTYTAVRFWFTLFIALIFGSMFWDLGSKRSNEQDIFNAMGSLYTSVLFLGIQNAVAVQPVVATERTVFYREKAAGMYSAIPYAFAQVAIEFPYIFFQVIFYGVIVYAMIGFEWTAAKFFWFIFFMYFTLLYFTFYGMMTVAVSPNHHIAYIIAAAFISIWNLFSGFIIPRPRIPIWWRWYAWACPVAWTLYGLIASQFGDIKERMDSQITVEEFLRSYFGFRHDFLGVVASMVVGFTALFILTFAFSIKIFNFQRR